MAAVALTATASVPGQGDSSAEPFGAALGPLPFSYDLYTFRGEDGATAVVASFAVPVRELQRESDDGEVRYRFDVSFVLTDTARQSVLRSDDSVYVGTPRALDGDHLLHTWIEVDAAPSADTQQRVIMTDAGRPGVGQMYQSPFPIPDYSGDSLMLSDLALGFPDETHGWQRGEASLALLPSSQFPESAFDVYYEIYNLPPSHDYTTEISIQSLDGPEAEASERTAAVRTLFSGRAGAETLGTIGELRRVESALPRGAYELTVTVRDEQSSEVATHARRFQVQGWRAGTTLVPALSRRRDAPTSP
jgi:hypothetical protein